MHHFSHGKKKKGIIYKKGLENDNSRNSAGNPANEKEQDICILAHAYQGQEILEVADYTGDSYGLSVQASKRDCSGVIMCGVRFMAETCKILSPKKKSGWLIL